MKTAFLIAMLSSLLVGCASRYTRLEGRWKSNKALTVATMDSWRSRSGKPMSAKQRAALTSLFGRLIVTYDRRTATCELPPRKGLPAFRQTSRYRIVASVDDSLVLVSTSPLTEKPEINHIHFDGPNRYWVYLHGSGMKEFFDRITP
jgi:hypothetical protein